MSQNRERIDFNNPGTWPGNWIPDPDAYSGKTFGFFKSIGDPNTGVIRNFRVSGQVKVVDKPANQTEQVLTTQPYLLIDTLPRGLYRAIRFRRYPNEIQAVMIIDNTASDSEGTTKYVAIYPSVSTSKREGQKIEMGLQMSNGFSFEATYLGDSFEDAYLSYAPHVSEKALRREIGSQPVSENLADLIERVQFQELNITPTLKGELERVITDEEISRQILPRYQMLFSSIAQEVALILDQRQRQFSDENNPLAKLYQFLWPQMLNLLPAAYINLDDISKNEVVNHSITSAINESLFVSRWQLETAGDYYIHIGSSGNPPNSLALALKGNSSTDEIPFTLGAYRRWKNEPSIPSAEAGESLLYDGMNFTPGFVEAMSNPAAGDNRQAEDLMVILQKRVAALRGRVSGGLADLSSDDKIQNGRSGLYTLEYQDLASPRKSGRVIFPKFPSLELVHLAMKLDITGWERALDFSAQFEALK